MKTILDDQGTFFCLIRKVTYLKSIRVKVSCMKRGFDVALSKEDISDFGGVVQRPFDVDFEAIHIPVLCSKVEYSWNRDISVAGHIGT